MPRVFISHASADNPFGYELVAFLRAKLGSVDAVWYDSQGQPTDGAAGIGWSGGIHPAGYWEREIFRELRERDVFVVLLSQAAIDSPWVQDEILLAWKQKNERGRPRAKVIVPVIVPEAHGLRVPEPLDLLQFVSFVERPGWTTKQAYEALRAAIHAERTQLRHGEPEPPFDLTELPVPEPFVGREQELAWLMERLTPGATSAITALRGLGGIGKTGLAAKAVQQVFEAGRFPSGIIVQDCRDLSDPVIVLKRVLTSFDIERREPESDNLKALGEQAQKLLRGRKILIVLDNVEPDLEVTAVLQRLQSAGAAVLLTARDVLPLPPDVTLELELLPPRAALDLFAKWYRGVAADALSPAERALVERIVTALGWHTLAVKLAGAEAHDLARPLASFAHEVEAHPLLIQGQGANVTLAVKETLLRSVTKLPTDGDLGNVRQLFAALTSFMAPVVGGSVAAASATDTPLTAASLESSVRLIPSLEFGREAVVALAEALDLPAPERAVDLLSRRALLNKATDSGMPQGTDRERLRVHPLLRELAVALADGLLDDITRQKVSHALAVHYMRYVSTASDAALDTDAGSIAGTLEWAHAAPTSVLTDQDRYAIVVGIGMRMEIFWRDRSRTREMLRYLPWTIAALDGINTALEERQLSPIVGYLRRDYGHTLQIVGLIDEAETQYQEGLRIFEGIDDEMGIASLSEMLGRLETQRGRMDEAQHLYEKAERVFRMHGDAKGLGVLLSDLGQLAQRRGQLAEAVAYYQQALAIARQTQNRREESASLGRLGQVAQLRGELDAAERYYQESLAFRQEIPNRQDEGVALSRLGEVAQLRGKLEAAEDYYQQALALHREVQDRRHEGDVLSSLGQVAQLRSELDAAERYYQQALVIIREVQDRQGEGKILASLGTVALRRSQLEQAEDYNQQSLMVRQEVMDRRGEGLVLGNLGQVAQIRGQFGAAEDYYKHSLAIAREVQNRQGESAVLTYLGQLAQRRGQLKEAEHYYQESLVIRRDVQDRQGEGDILGSLGQVAQLNRQLADAQQYFQQALAIHREALDRQGEGVDLFQLALITEAHGDLDRTETLLRESLAIAIAVQSRLGIADSLLELGRVLVEQRDQRDEGCQLLNQAIDLYHELGLPGETNARATAQRLGCL